MHKPMPKFTRRHVDRFWSRVAQDAPTECWEWQSYSYNNGYGCFKAFCKGWLAHRVAYYFHYNEDPGDLCVCHTCDNPICCNPKHLWLGTPRENNQDKLDKGRQSTKATVIGSQHPRAKLTDAKVRKIRKLYATGRYTLEQLGVKYGVSFVTIHHIAQRKTWTHI